MPAKHETNKDFRVSRLLSTWRRRIDLREVEVGNDCRERAFLIVVDSPTKADPEAHVSLLFCDDLPLLERIRILQGMSMALGLGDSRAAETLAEMENIEIEEEIAKEAIATKESESSGAPR